jgi:hypothetical protein
MSHNSGRTKAKFIRRNRFDDDKLEEKRKDLFV